MRPDPDPYGDGQSLPTRAGHIDDDAGAPVRPRVSPAPTQEGVASLLPVVVISTLVALAVTWLGPRFVPQLRPPAPAEQPLIVIYDPVRYAQGMQGLAKEEIDRRLAQAKSNLGKLRDAGALVLSGDGVAAAPEEMYLRNHDLDGGPASGGR